MILVNMEVMVFLLFAEIKGRINCIIHVNKQLMARVDSDKYDQS